MAENQPHVPSPAEMLEPWRQMAERFEGQWNSYFNQMMGTDQFANLLNTYTQGFLGMQQGIAQNVERSFQAMNLPTRSDLTALGERLSALEAQIAGLSTEQRRLADALEHANSRRNGS
jgi:BMFP domain-containing protein YqiC